MNLELTEEQKLLQKSVREFAEAEVKPLAKEIDETGQFPRDTFKKAAELGLTGVALPEKYGGAGMDHICYTIVIEEIARVCASTSVILSVQNSLYCDPIYRFGTEEQKQKFLVPFARGEKIGCYALTEPQAGSNAAALADESGSQGRSLRRQRHESLDHQWRRGGRRDRLREYAAGKGREGNHGAGGRERHAGIHRRQGREEAGHSRHGLHRAFVHRLRSAGVESHRR